MLKILFISAIIPITLVIFVFAYYGGLKKIQFQIIEQGGELLVYQNIIGDYRQSAAVMDTIYNSLLNDYKIKTYKGFGIYYDNPQKVPKNELRSEAGCVLENQDSAKISTVQNEFKTKKYPYGKYIVTEFPFKGKLSVIISLMKVYPELNKYIKEKGYSEQGAVMEIYDIPNKKIVYRKEIVK